MRRMLPWTCSARRLATAQTCSRGRTSYDLYLSITDAGRRYSSNGRLSIATGVTDPPLLDLTIPQHFSSIVSRFGDSPAVTSHSPSLYSSSSLSRPATLSYQALDALSNRLANTLQRPPFNITPGDRIAISLGNNEEFAALTYACFKLGAVLVPLNPGFNARQVTAALKHLDAKVLIIGAVTDLSYKPAKGRSNEELLREVAGDLKGSKVESEGIPSLHHVVVVDNRAYHPEVNFPLEDLRAATKYEDLTAGSEHTVKPSKELHPDDVINIQFTSGTTSRPKAAQLSHRSTLNNGHLIAARMGLTPQDRIILPPPLFHCFGCILGYMASATTGAHLIFPSPAFDPVATLRAAIHHDGTAMYGVTTMLVAMMEELATGPMKGMEGDLPKGMRKGIMAGSSVPEEVMAKSQKVFGLEDVVICYGMTETSPVSCMTSPSDPPSKRASTVGKVMPHTTVKVVNPLDSSEILPLNQPGELVTSGYLLMKGYFGDEAKTSEAMKRDEDGTMWIYTGDEATIDEEGYVKITGRIKDLIIRGGENIHPLEVENCIFRMAGVREVSVVGVPDEKLGEAVAAFVVVRAGWKVAKDGKVGDGEDVISENQVRDWVRKELSGHLVPKYVFWVEEYPKTTSGKIQKFKLREQAVEALGLKGK